MGEIRRYFRDNSRPVHVPRGMQEFSLQVGRAERELTGRLDRSPTPEELAAHLGVEEARVLEALSLDDCVHPISLDGEFDMGEGGDGAAALERCLGTEDAGLQRAEDRLCVQEALRRLSEPLRQVIELRYLKDLSQREVGRRLGLSQMQVCRLEKRGLHELQEQVSIH